LVLFFLVLGAVAAQIANTFYVAVKSAEVKSSSGIFAGVLASLPLGEAVTVLQTGNKWFEVTTARGVRGWVLKEALSARRVVPSTRLVDSGEVAMAGKGFTSEVEKIFKQQNSADYSQVDAMEARTVTLTELQAFLREGRLAMGE
jgi:SH3-like domain-containing protein